MSKDSVCYVYLMEDLLHSGIKIGISDDPEQRKPQVEHEFKTKVSVRYIVEYPDRPKALKQEHRMHRRFAQYRVDGEWFKVSIEHIMDAFPDLDYAAVDLETRSQFIDDLVAIAIVRKVLTDMGPSGELKRKRDKILAYMDTLKTSDWQVALFHAAAMAHRDFLGERRYVRWRIGEIAIGFTEISQRAIIHAFWNKLIESGEFDEKPDPDV